jgi:predicted nucleotidyltransferase
MMSEEFSKLMSVNRVALFGSYVVGVVLMTALAFRGAVPER